MNQPVDPRGPHQSRKVVQTVRPRLAPLAKFGDERFRLVWLGEVQRPAAATAATGHRITARFANAGSQVNVLLPLPALPLLALDSIWESGLFTGFGPSQHGKVTIDLGAVTEVHRTLYDPNDVIAPWAYPLHMGKRSPCQLLPTVEGSELIVPTSEILRTSYFFDHRLIEPMLSGAFGNAALGSSLRLPWVPEGTKRLSAAEVMLTHRQDLGESVSLRLSRLLFDDAVQRSIAKLSVAYRHASGPSTFLLPLVDPSFEQRALWHIRYLDVPAYKGHPPRRLVLTIQGQEQPLPYERVILFVDRDSRQGPNSDDPGLKPYSRRTTSIVVPDDGTLALYGGAGEAGVDRAVVAGLGFQDNVFEVPVIRPAKSWQTYRSQGAPSDSPVPVHGIGTDPTAAPVPGLADQRDGASMDAGPAANGPAQTPPALVDVRPVFDDLIKVLQPKLPGWQVEYLATPHAPGVVKVQHFRSKMFRPFLVLHVYHEFRHVYVLKAGPLADHERYRVLICEQLSGAAIPMTALGHWLSRFPYREGHRWIDGSPKRALRLRYDPLIHQPRAPDKLPEDVHREFVRRIAGRVTGFVA